MTTGLLDAFDSISWSETLLSRLHAASAELSRKQGLHVEKEWLNQAIDRVTAAREGLGDVLVRAMRLPELEALREDHARALQQAAVDAIERLQAGITFHAGTRSPVLEALFGKVKFAVVRRADKDDFERFSVDFEKRLNSSYCKRMFTDPQFQFIGPVLEELRTAFTAWRNAFSAERLPASEETAIRDELDSSARRLDLPMRQARLLAEAALAPLRNAFEDSGLGNRPKRRNAKAVVTESEEHEPTGLTDESLADAREAEATAAEVHMGAPSTGSGRTGLDKDGPSTVEHTPAKKPRRVKKLEAAVEAPKEQ